MMTLVRSQDLLSRWNSSAAFIGYRLESLPISTWLRESECG
jgi:hypothetical protein